MSDVEAAIVIPSSPEDKKKISDAIKEMSNSFTMSDAQRDHRKSIVDAIHEATGFDKKTFRRMAKDYHKNQFKKTISENETYALAYETIMGSEE